MNYRIFVVALLMTACSPAVSTPTSAPSQAESTQEEASPLQEIVQEADAVVERAVWQSIPLINAETGESFALADFAGRTVYVEPMATWCTNCRAQQQDVRTVREQLGTEDYVYISLSVEPNDTTEGLKDYRERENFPWIFALAPIDMVQALVDQFGRTVTNPPSTPHFIISPNGAVSQLATGRHSADQLMADLAAAAGA